MTGLYGTVFSISRRSGDGRLQYGVAYDCGERRDNVPAHLLESLERTNDGEESMTLKPLCDRVTSLEKYVADHEQQVGRLDKWLERLGGVVNRHAARGESLDDRVTALERMLAEIREEQQAINDDHGKIVESLRIGEARLELNARRIEEVADKTAQRFDVHHGQINSLSDQIVGSVGVLKDSLDALWRKFDRLEAKDGDPLRRVPGVYTGTGDDARESDETPKPYDYWRPCGAPTCAICKVNREYRDNASHGSPDDPVSRDVHASVSVIEYALSDAMRSSAV